MARKATKQKGFQEGLEKLLTLGKSKGFLTYDEVNDTLSGDVDSSEEIDQVFDSLENKGIRIVNSEDDMEIGEGTTELKGTNEEEEKEGKEELEKLKNSLSQFGCVRPLIYVIDGATGDELTVRGTENW